MDNQDFFKNKFKGKKVTLMGLGLLGRGVGDAAFFAEAGANLTVTDLKSEKELALSVEALKKFPNIKFVLGEHRLADFQKADLIVKAAGVPLDSPFILEAQKHGVPIVISTALFAEYTPAEVVGVTGTRGKSTVAYLLEAILKEYFKKTRKKVFLGGNILGISTIAQLPKISAHDVAVLELDSWQLQGFGNTHGVKLLDVFQGFSPHIAVFTTFMPDHLNYYKGDIERYFADKANIYRFQNENDFLIVSEQVADLIKKLGPKPKSKMIVARADDVPDSWRIKILGEHNRLNVALALATAKVLGVPERVIERAVSSFKAAPGRLEFVRKFKGIEIYNDTNATTPEATIAALEAFGKDNKTVLIFGGADKKLDASNLIKILPSRTKAVIVLPGTGTERVRTELERISEKVPIKFVNSMNEAVQSAVSLAQKGDRILMSPAFASFGLFKNEYERGDQFNEAIKRLK